LEYRFEDSAEWTTRGEVIVGKDSNGKIVQVEVENGNVYGNIKEELEKQCKKDHLY
jgi:hypothetical protein